MDNAAKEKRYEQAAKYRDILYKVEELIEKKPSFNIPLDKRIDCLAISSDFRKVIYNQAAI